MDVTRRKYLAAVGSAGAAAVAGCTTPQSEGGRSQRKVAWPTVQSEKIDEWSLTGTRKQQFAPMGGVKPYARTRIYENTALRKETKEKTLGQFDRSLATFFATHIQLQGYTAMFATPSMIAERVFADFEQEMRKSGIEDIETVPVSSPRPSYDSPAELAEYRGTFETPRITKTMTIEGAGERTLVIPPKRLTVTGLAAVWKGGARHAFAAGGAFPAEDYEATSGFSASGNGKGDGIDVRVSVDLNIPFERLRRDVVEMAESVTMSQRKD